MKKNFIFTLLMLLTTGMLFSLTGFVESSVFAISDETLPVSLSSFMAIPNVSNDAIAINWTTQSESNLVGYHIYRSESENLDAAENINSDIIFANNTNLTNNYSYHDSEIESEKTYYYWIKSVGYSCNEFFGPVQVTVQENHDVEDFTIPQFTSLESIYPNPFNPSTSIKFYLAESSNVKLEIYNIKGQLINILTDETYAEGFHNVVWNGKNMNGKDCSSGIYLIRMNSSLKNQVKKAILVK